MIAPGTTTRRGTALITALVILVGLVLLGLPFLFSQSASRAGAASFAAGQAARAYLVSAQNLGLALAIYTQEEHWKQGGRQGSTALEETLKDFGSGVLTPPPVLIERTTPTGGNRAAIDLRTLPGNWNQRDDRARIGLELSDESGRLDMNSLSFTGWDALFQRVGLGVRKPGGGTSPVDDWADWDDNEVWDDPIGMNYSDGDRRGQLINRIMGWRLDHRFTQVDDLLQIDPTDRPQPNASKTWWRPRLTRDEVEKLRPFLTVHTLGQGRAGLMDAGSVVTVDTGNPSQTFVYPEPGLQEFLPHEGFAWSEGKDGEQHHVEGLLGPSTTTGQWFTLVLAPNLTRDFAHRAVAGGGSPFFDGANPALMTAVPPPVNGHALTPTVGYVLGVLRKLDGVPVDIGATPVAPLAGDPTGMPATASPWGPIITSLEQVQAVRATAGAQDLRSFSQSLLANAATSFQRMTIPLEWASYGLTRISVASQVVDAAGHPASRAQRTVVVQALPQEELLERRWLTQGAFQQAVDQHFTSNLATLPNPVDRVGDAVVHDPQPTAGTPVGPVAGTGLTARPLRNFGNLPAYDAAAARHASNFLQVDWQASFGAGIYGGTVNKPQTAVDAIAGSQTKDGLEPTGFTDWNSPGNALQNDGLHLGTGKTIAWKLDAAKGPLKIPNGGSQDLPARHLSAWVCPTEDWNTGDPVILLETRTPSANLVQPADGSAASSDLQNLLQLAWDPTKKLLVLSWASPAAEHLTKSVLRMHVEAPTVLGDYPRKDSRSRASATDPALAPAQGNDANLQKISPLLRAGRASLVYRMPNGFPIGQWRHLQVIIGGGHPGGLGLLVDGIAGRDLTQTGDATSEKLGDHALLPSLVLDKQEATGTGLPRVDVLGTSTPAEVLKLLPTEIKVRLGPLAKALGVKALDLFPSRGVVRIHDEFITYDELKETDTTVTLTGCRRGARQDTRTDEPDLREWRWPGTQAHAPDSLVIPGSFRGNLGTGILYGGKTALADPLTGGDVSDPSGAHYHEVWGTFTPLASQVGPTATLTLIAPALEWPAYGIIEVKGTKVVGTSSSSFTDHYEFTRSGGSFVLADLQGWAWRGAQITGTPTMYTTNGQPVTVRLCSTRVEDLHEPMGATAFPDAGMYQVMDVNGRMEWLTYDGMAKSAAGGRVYFTNSGGLAGYYRGQERTCFDDSQSFPTGSSVLPVHTGFPKFGQLLTPGDALTLIPPDLSSRGRQVVVRYVATDGYGDPNDPHIGYNDVHNGLFSLTDAVDPIGFTPLVIPAGTIWEGVTAPGWSGGLDLTQLAHRGNLQSTALPRLDRMSDGAAVGRLAFGSGDKDRGAPATSQRGMILDGCAAGPWNNDSRWGLALFKGGAWVDTLEAGDPLDAVYVLLDQALSAPKMGLIDLDGEIFAYRTISPGDQAAISQIVENWSGTLGSRTLGMTTGLGTVPGKPGLRNWAPYVLQLIGRGQLGSAKKAHRVDFRDGPDVPASQWPHLTVLRLPIGPVGRLDDPGAFESSQWATLDAGLDQNPQFINAPAILVADPQGDPELIECLAFTAPNHRSPISDSSGTVVIPNPDQHKSMQVPWLRGLYNTSRQTWADANGLHPLLIGWWPRYASALPASGQTKQHLRSRYYAWAGFPLRLVRAQFDGGTPFTVHMDTTAPANHDLDALFTVTARAMAGTVGGSLTARGALEFGEWNNWLDVTPAEIPLANTMTNLSGLYGDFAGKETDGVEVRVTWQYKAQNPGFTPLERLAEAMNRAPVIQGVTMTAHAPACVVGVEDK